MSFDPHSNEQTEPLNRKVDLVNAVTQADDPCEIDQLYKLFHDHDSSAVEIKQEMPHQQLFQNGFDYRDHQFDENSTLPLSTNQNEVSLLSPDDSAMPFVLGDTLQEETDAINSLLVSGKMHITEDTFSTDPFLDPSSQYESPRKISRVNVDRLCAEPDDAMVISSFMFTKFGTPSNDDQTSPDNNQRPTESCDSVDNSEANFNTNSQQTSSAVSLSPHQSLLLNSNELTSVSHQQHHQMIPQTEPYLVPAPSSGPVFSSPPPSQRSKRRSPLVKVPNLAQQFPEKHEGISLKLVNQPETQHRARYMTEGSRGAVKDTTQQGHPVVQLEGWDDDASLEMFIGTDVGKVRPHGFYQACRVSGKNSTPCKEREVDGTVVIEMKLERSKGCKATVDCIGILKLRNTDVERRIGIVKIKKKSTRCRLVFRVNLIRPDGSYLTLQTASNIINCTQPAGQPEISKMSLDCSSVTGGPELFVIGKNFVKGFTVKFQETDGEADNLVWEKEAELDSEYLHNSHFICTVPPYKNEHVLSPVSVHVVVEASGGFSEPVSFTYMPALMPGQYTPLSLVSSSTPPSNTAASSSHNSPRSFIAPEALELVAQIQQTSDPNGIFKIPDGVDFISQDDPLKQNNISHTSQELIHDDFYDAQ